MPGRVQRARLLVIVLPGAGWLDWRRFSQQGGANEMRRLAAAGYSAPLENIAAGGREEGLTTLALGCSVALVRDAVLPVWEQLRAAGKTVHVIGWPGAAADVSGAHGVTVSANFAEPTAAPGDPWPPMQGAVQPESLAHELAALRVVPESVDAGWLQFFVPDLAAVDQERDPRLALLACAVAAALSLTAVAEHLLEEGAAEAVFVVIPTQEKIAALSGADDPFAGCVRAAWDFHALLLGRLLTAAGESANVWLAGLPKWPPLTASRTRGFVLAGGPDISTSGRIPQRHVADLANEWLTACGVDAGHPEAVRSEVRPVPGGNEPPGALPALLLSGESALHHREWIAAEQHFRRAAALDPDEPLAPLGLSVALLRQRRWEEAEAAARRSLALDESISTAHFYLGRALFRQQQFAAARDAFVQAMDERPPCRAAAMWLIWIGERIQRDFRGADHWRRMLAGAPPA